MAANTGLNSPKNKLHTKNPSGSVAYSQSLDLSARNMYNSHNNIPQK